MATCGCGGVWREFARHACDSGRGLRFAQSECGHIRRDGTFTLVESYLLNRLNVFHKLTSHHAWEKAVHAGRHLIHGSGNDQ
ncbi:hypothetical protein Fuma_00046 [Fuerstiella marisgermanici]|uniref:Uncharacterized protein n=1 Tax=Fuerstiella marisgermanici TaxID=1891926 RepID=A0A1P8W8U3_9PLAN|nr:hypothetical protein Fuma_00046 [Fuerstiella marisgermanici]